MKQHALLVFVLGLFVGIVLSMATGAFTRGDKKYTDVDLLRTMTLVYSPICAHHGGLSEPRFKIESKTAYWPVLVLCDDHHAVLHYSLPGAK